MMILKWLLLAPLSVVFTLIAILLSPILALLVKPDGYLPSWLSWFSTPDNKSTGDESFQKNQMRWTTSKYLYALFWLCRNPSYGFDHAIGAKIPAGFTYSSKGDEGTTNAPIHNGWVYRKIDNAWQFYAVYQWSKTKCWKINFGWKLWGKLEAGQVRQLVCTMSPFAKCS